MVGHELLVLQEEVQEGEKVKESQVGREGGERQMETTQLCKIAVNLIVV